MDTQKHILLFGAGKSATVLIDFLKQTATKEQWLVTVADTNLATVQQKVGVHDRVKAQEVDIENEDQRSALIQSADVVISLLPPFLQYSVAKDCVVYGKHLLTASYIDPDIQLLANEIKQKGILFLCEMGLDPGIDHMSAMQLFHRIKADGGRITSFRSHCGGLVAPESDDNPWHYKFSWNPRNVVMAGKAGAVYKENSQIKKETYETLFSDCGKIFVEGIGELAYYPNRDSLSYIPTYQLEEADTFLRTTLRYPDFCRGWHHIVAAGLTDETNVIETDSLPLAAFFEQHFRKKESKDLTDEAKKQFEFLGLYDETLINKGRMSSAEILQWILETKWALLPGDKDLIVMQHEIEYVVADEKSKVKSQKSKIKSELVVKGEDNLHTAMAKTVGLPLGIAAMLLLKGEISETGLLIPTVSGIYEPVLKMLAEYGVVFTETTPV